MTKRVILLCLLCTRFFVLKAQPDSICAKKTFTLSGKIRNAQDGAIYLIYSTEHGWKVDSTSLKRSEFVFSDEIAEPTYAQLLLYNPSDFNNSVDFFIEPAKMEIVAERDSLICLKLKGSASQNDFEKLVDMKKGARIRLDKLQKEIEVKKAAQNIAEASDQGSLQKEIRKIEHEMSVAEKEMFKSDSLFIMQNPESYVAAYLIYSNMQIEHFKLFPIDSFYYRMPNAVKNTSYGRHILLKMKENKIAPIGDTAPLFSSKDQNGIGIKLADFKNTDYILLDFWGSWCGPCRMLSPWLKKIYDQYNSKGLKIISIAINDKEKNWRRAIEDDKTGQWTQILDDSSNAIRDLYGASFVPLYFLIDKQGIIIGRYSGGEKSYGEKAFYELYRELETLFGEGEK